MKKRTKIIASLGPASSSGVKLEKMLHAGTDVFRINLSHTKIEDAKKIIEKIKLLNIAFNREADEKDQLYGSISKKEIINFLKDNEIIIHSDDIEMQNSIRSLGEHQIVISPYLDISHTIVIKVNKN